MKYRLLILIILAVLSAGIIWQSSNKGEEIVVNNNITAVPEIIADAEIYQVVATETVIRWSGKNSVTGSAHYGTVDLTSGWVAVKEGKLLGGEFVVNMQTIVNEDLSGASKERIEKHLSGDDFFMTERYPESKLVLTNVKKQTGDDYEISGNLTIKDITDNITFPATIVLADGQLKAEANLSIDRTNWGVEYGSANFFSNLGDKAIADLIDFQINFTAKAEASL